MALSQQYLTPQQYLEIERGNDFRSEYIDGVMVAMAGPSPRHNYITTKLTKHLDNALENKPCTTLNSNQMIWAPGDSHLFSDIVVFCGEGEFVNGILVNPTVVMEVLSPSTESRDRGIKLLKYRKITSLRHYVLVSQNEPYIEVLTRENDDSQWSRQEAKGMEAQIVLPSIDVTQALSDIYKGYLNFPMTEPQPSPSAG